MAHTRPKGLLVLTVALAIGIVALVLSFQNALALGRQADQRNEDRIASDVASCQRGNVLRRQVKDGFAAVDDAVNQIVDVADPSPGVRALLAPPLARLATASDAVKTTDCQAAVPGAKETP